MSSPLPVVEAVGVRKSYRRRAGGRVVEVPVLAEVDLAVAAGERVAIVGESGTGKTTLLNLLGGLDRPDAGEIRHRGRPLPVDVTARARWRRRHVGFVFQFHGLLPELSAEENVALAGRMQGMAPADAREAARELLGALGLGERCDHYPDELSGGEQQRVAIGRALVGRPTLVLADEPTGNLDPATGERVWERLVALQEELRFALVVATHSRRLAASCHRVLPLAGGALGEAP